MKQPLNTFLSRGQHNHVATDDHHCLHHVLNPFEAIHRDGIGVDNEGEER
ncbi:hypothetical protein L1D34_28715 [Vibrio mediterranei]|nr:hypothetical protein [Vibrio mediterranei]MCG9628793.1 hypothetical protein [Vibrio mediterranei]